MEKKNEVKAILNFCRELENVVTPRKQKNGGASQNFAFTRAEKIPVKLRVRTRKNRVERGPFRETPLHPRGSTDGEASKYRVDWRAEEMRSQHTQQQHTSVLLHRGHKLNVSNIHQFGSIP